MTFIDLFAGIGGVKIGCEQAGFKASFSNDIDALCKVTFDYNFAPESELYLKDISQIPSEIFPKAHLLTAGFPCQPFSIAGARKGFTDAGRGDLFFEIVRILKDKKPKAFLLENVKNLKTHDKGKTLALIYAELKGAGYYVKDCIMNTATHADLPQNRERIYIVGFLSKSACENFKFPEPIPLTQTIHDCLLYPSQILPKYYAKEPLYSKLKKDVVSRDTVYQWRRKYVRENKSSLCPTLTANMGTGGHNVPIVVDAYGIRKLTPRECANFQGFPKHYKLPDIADCHLYKQIGNSVSVPIIKRLASEIRFALVWS